TSASPDENGWARHLASLVVKAATVGLMAIVLLSPLIVALVRESATADADTATPLRTVIANSADLLALFIPAPAHVKSSDINPHGGNPALGWSVIFLALLNFGFWILDFGRSRIARDPKSKIQNPKSHLGFWAMVALVFAVLSFGPHLLVAGNDTGVPLPYLLLSKLPFLS